MLARTHAFSRFGAFLSLIAGGVLAAAIVLLVEAGFRTLVEQPFTIPSGEIAPYPTVNHFGKPEEAPHYLETLPGGVKHEIIQIDGDEGTFDRAYPVDAYTR